MLFSPQKLSVTFGKQSYDIQDTPSIIHTNCTYFLFESLLHVKPKCMFGKKNNNSTNCKAIEMISGKLKLPVMYY